MIYILEPLLTFFMIIFTSNLELDSATRGILTLFVFFVVYNISNQVYANFTLALSFFLTSFRDLKDVVLLIILGAAGTFLGSLVLFLLGEPFIQYENGLELWKVLIIEIFTSFFIAIIYYCMFVDVRNQSQIAGGFAVAAMYAGLSIAFPNISAGNFFKIICVFSRDTSLVFGSIIGQLIGSVFGGMTFKYLICENNALKMKEIEINTDEMKINF
jgi:hypothetical protein